MPRTPQPHPKTPIKSINLTNSTSPTNYASPTNTLLYALIALLGFILIVRLASLALYPLMDPTEARYAEMARKILELNDWVVLHYTYEQPFWGKPPLSFWGSAVGMWIFGVNEFGARIAPFVASLLVCALFFAWDFGDKSNSTNVANSNANGEASVSTKGIIDSAKKRHLLLALASAIILSSSAIGLVSAGAVMTDEFLLLCVGLCMVGFWRCVGDSRWADEMCEQTSTTATKQGSESHSDKSHETSKTRNPTHNPKTRKSKLLWGYVFFIGIGLGLLAKGPLILVLAGVPLVGFVVLVFLARRFCDCVSLSLDFRHFPLFGGSALALLIALPWYVACEVRSEGFLEYFIVGEHFKRFLVSGWEGDLYGSAHSRRLGSIWLFFLVAFLPWSVAFVGFLCAFVAKIFGKNSDCVPNAQKSSEFKHLSGINKRVYNALFAPLLADNAKGLYLTLWLLAPLAFFTLSRNVLWTYVLPCALPFSILLARWIFQSRLKTYIWIVPFVIIAGFGAFIATPSAERAFAPYHHKDIFEHFSGDSELLYIGLSPSYSAQFYTHAKIDNGLEANSKTLRAQSPAPFQMPFREKIYSLNDLKECADLRGDLGDSCDLVALLSAKNRVTIAIKSSDFASYSEIFARLAPRLSVVAESKGITLLQNF